MRVTVDNAAPVVVVAEADTAIDEATSFSGSSVFIDAGSDTWTGTVDYGDGSGPQPPTLAADKTFELSHVYDDNGAGNYGFMVTATDGQLNGGGGGDKFRIKIWDKNNADAIVYDNQLGVEDTAELTTILGGGKVIIHDGGEKLLASGLAMAPQTRRLQRSSLVSEYFSHDQLGSLASPAPTYLVDSPLSLWIAGHSSRTALPEASVPARIDRVFELMAMDPNWDQLFGGGWKVDEDETDTLVEGDVFGQSWLPIEDFISDSENTDDEQIDEDLLDEFALGLI